MRKKISFIMFVVFVILLLCPLQVFAATSEAQQAAQSLYQLGLFRGTSQGFELDRAPTRQEAVTMLVRLLGKENEAQTGSYQYPFTDVDTWAAPYVGYAYQQKLTQGTTPSTFGGQQLTTTPQYLTFILRALGYQSEVDFSWQTASVFTDHLGLTNGEYTNKSNFTRGDAALLSYRALFHTCKESQTALLEKLKAQGAISTPASSGLQVYFLDVGQGDCALIQVDGINLLIDAGNSSDSEMIINDLKSLGVSRIDHVIATHPHADHIGSMAEIVNTFEIGSVYMSKIPANTKTYEALLDAIAAKGLTIKSPSPGTAYSLGKATLKFLSPAKQYEELNDNSLVCKLTYGNHSILFAGDMEALAETDLLQNGYDPQATVLKVAHHGSDTSSSQAFLNAVKPLYAIISVGKDNSYGHPSDAVIERLTALGAKIYRTDQSGTIRLFSDGMTLAINGVTVLQSATATDSGTGIYIGNKNTKKFHLPTCRSLPAPQNQIVFSSRQEALEQGYTPCSICKP